MSKLVEINFAPDKRTLRNFGFIAVFGFGLLAMMAWTESFIFGFGLGQVRKPLIWFFAGLAGYCLLFSLVRPAGNKAIYIGLSVITIPIGIVLSYVIMGFLFFVVIGIVGLVLRLFRYDPLDRQLDSTSGTYWKSSKPPRPNSDYFNQY